MKILYKIIFLLSLTAIITSCKKEVILDGSKATERSNSLEKELKTKLNSPDGWILLITSSDKSVKTAMPFIMKFDTLSNKVSMKSVLGDESESYFTISASTGMPLLTFSTKSLISGIYQKGGTGITDYFFKVLKVSDDVIEIQSYRKGNVYKSEGGSVLKMIKIANQPWIKDWMKNGNDLISHPDFSDNDLTIDLTVDGKALPATSIYLYSFGGRSVAFVYDYRNTGYDQYVGGTIGYNSICYSGNYFNANCFLIRKIDQTSFDVFAIDKDGKEIMTGKVTKN
nr:hypothetical protein [Pedobacter sp. ASV2]